MTSSPISPASGRGPCRRDRHGRGFRGNVVPPHLPGHRSRRERFDEIVMETVDLIVPRFAARLRYLDVAVEEVPAADPAPWEEQVVPLGRYYPATRERPGRIVLYRRPIETHAEDADDLALLVRQVFSEQVGHMLSIPPEDVDPGAWYD